VRMTSSEPLAPVADWRRGPANGVRGGVLRPPTLCTWSPWATGGGYGGTLAGYRPGMVIDREWDEPIYQQVAGILRDQITSVNIEPRRPIPPIRTLCQTYGIARATAGKAIRLLGPSSVEAHK